MCCRESGDHPFMNLTVQPPQEWESPAQLLALKYSIHPAVGSGHPAHHLLRYQKAASCSWKMNIPRRSEKSTSPSHGEIASNSICPPS